LGFIWKKKHLTIKAKRAIAREIGNRVYWQCLYGAERRKQQGGSLPMKEMPVPPFLL